MSGKLKPDSKKIVELADKAELFHDPNGRTYATFRADPTHRETWAIHSTQFKSWLNKCFFNSEDRAPGSEHMAQALLILQGKAQYEGDERTVHVRMAEADDCIWYDLGNANWDIVRVSADTIITQLSCDPTFSVDRSS